jgi:hypothetical protein
MKEVLLINMNEMQLWLYGEFLVMKIAQGMIIVFLPYYNKKS